MSEACEIVDPEQGSTKQHAQYGDCMEEKQTNNGYHHFNKCNHKETKTKSQKHKLFFADVEKCFNKL